MQHRNAEETHVLDNACTQLLVDEPTKRLGSDVERLLSTRQAPINPNKRRHSEYNEKEEDDDKGEEAAGDGKKKRKLQRGPAPGCLLHALLPIEMLRIILDFVAPSEEDDPMNPNYMGAVCRFVCRMWRDLLPPRDPWSVVHIDFAAAVAHDNNLRLLQWALQNGCPVNYDVAAAAAREGHLGLIRWWVEKDLPVDFEACIGAARGGHLEVLEFLKKNCVTCSGADSWRFISAAAKGGHIQVIEWAVHAELLTRGEDGIEAAAETGHVGVLEWALPNWVTDRSEFAHKVCIGAARRGHVAVLEWTKSKGILPSRCRTLCAEAALHGRLEALMWLRENRCAWSGDVFVEAAKGGHAHIIEWAHANGCPTLPPRAGSVAAFGGHVDCLVALERAGMKIGAECMITAIERGHTDVVRWCADRLKDDVHVGHYLGTAAAHRRWDIHDVLTKHFDVDDVWRARIKAISKPEAGPEPPLDGTRPRRARFPRWSTLRAWERYKKSCMYEEHPICL